MTEAKAPDPTRDAPPEPPVSYEEFLDWADEDVRVEWIDGEIHLMSPASDQHQDISRFLTSLFSLFIQEYWIVDPIREQLEVHHLEDGRYRGAFVGREGHADSVVLDGLWVEAEWFLQEPLPRDLDVASELGIV